MLLGLWLLCWGISRPVQAEVPDLDVRSVGRTDGYVQLAWKPSSPALENVHYELQQGSDPEFTEPQRRYEGADLGSFLSGLPRGTYYFRVRQRVGSEPWGKWTKPVEVVIDPYSLTFAWALFAVGAVLVLAILGFLLVSDRRVQAERAS